MHSPDSRLIAVPSGPETPVLLYAMLGADAFGMKGFLDYTWTPKGGRWLCKNKMFLELSSFHFCLSEFWEVGGWQEGDQF